MKFHHQPVPVYADEAAPDGKVICYTLRTNKGDIFIPKEEKCTGKGIEYMEMIEMTGK
mgnify:FL=1